MKIDSNLWRCYLSRKFKISPFKKVIDKLFESRQKYKDENNDVMQLLVNLIMNSLYGQQIRKKIEKNYEYKSEHWMLTEYDKRVLHYQEINHGIYIAKMTDDAGLEVEVKKVKTMPLHLGSFVLSTSKRIMNNFIHAIDGTYTNDFYYEGTDSMYFDNTHWDKLDKTGLVGKSDYKEKIIIKMVVFGMVYF